MEKMAIFMFEKQLSLMIKNKETFEVFTTAYTKRIKTKERTIMFANNFKDDNRFLLPLINKVRKDANDYIESDSFISNNDDIDFFRLVGNPKTHKTIVKVDLNGAYWNYAINNKIIKESTDDFLKDSHEGLTYKSMKATRLKSLGSLATRKICYSYVNGVEDKKKRKIKKELTRELYMEICRGVDYLMRDCAANVRGCIYYYWDCMFVDKEFAQDTIDYMKGRNYDINVGETTLEVINIGDNAYIVSSVDGKMYLIRKEDKHLISDEYEN